MELKQRPLPKPTNPSASTTNSSNSQRRRHDESETSSAFVALATLGFVICVISIVGYLVEGSIVFGLEEELWHLLGQEHQEPGVKYFTKAELAKYDGSNPDLPVYLSIKGRVYDVSAGKTYKKGGGYNGFAGKDATRAFLDLCFTPECLKVADTWEGLDEEKMKTIDDWVAFYEKEKKYSFVGYYKRE